MRTRHASALRLRALIQLVCGFRIYVFGKVVTQVAARRLLELRSCELEPTDMVARIQAMRDELNTAGPAE
jgi:hypothetical protein|eukprot:COSAG01_NODE_2254_length_8070_cov_6.783743_3_plen_70_part_00